MVSGITACVVNVVCSDGPMQARGRSEFTLQSAVLLYSSLLSYLLH